MSLSFLNMRTLLSTASKWTVESGSAFTDTTTSLPGRVSWTSKLMSTYKQSKIFSLKTKAFECPDTCYINSNQLSTSNWKFKDIILFQFELEEIFCILEFLTMWHSTFNVHETNSRRLIGQLPIISSILDFKIYDLLSYKLLLNKLSKF